MPIHETHKCFMGMRASNFMSWHFLKSFCAYVEASVCGFAVLARASVARPLLGVLYQGLGCELVDRDVRGTRCR